MAEQDTAMDDMSQDRACPGGDSAEDLDARVQSPTLRSQDATSANADMATDPPIQQDTPPETMSIDVADELARRKQALLQFISESTAAAETDSLATTATLASDEAEKAEERWMESFSPTLLRVPDIRAQFQPVDNRVALASKAVRLMGTFPPNGSECPSGHIHKSLQWSPDGNCILASTEDKRLRTVVLFPEENQLAQPVLAGTFQAADYIRAFAPSPGFNTDEKDTMRVIASIKENPITLFNINDPDSKRIASYSLMSPTDDVFHLPVDCIKFLPNNREFICGGDNSLAIFDIDRPQMPSVHFRTFKKRRSWRMRDPLDLIGKVSDFDYRSDGLLAVGTTERNLAFYENFGSGNALMVSSLKKISGSNSGNGINYLRWSPDGNYLYVAERLSDVIQVLDVRTDFHQLAVLTGRNAMTPQRLDIDVVSNDQGHYIMAGGNDGVVRMWNNPHARGETAIESDFSWKAHDDAVAGVKVNPKCAAWVATATGEAHFPSEEAYDSDSSDSDSSGSEESSSDGEESSPDSEESSDTEMEDVPDWIKVWTFTA
ncbi:putative wd repeat-containing protein 79 protein [Neofusicoccum parvum UCRNP2]|uniref:Putative wd repeat-containing protein 79 protein n=1 Tax=Botryosphaeria parva (strain UCR-NP2) TaxID=1287680 RepID=R1GFQ1_BOTPV|nr:putative wd repeat-containing protein 79 protein [Neofusicoccum parvum UCRNP2]